MEQAVCDVCKDIRIGKILIQTNFATGEPEVKLLHSTSRILKYIFITQCRCYFTVVLFTFAERY